MQTYVLLFNYTIFDFNVNVILFGILRNPTHIIITAYIGDYYYLRKCAHEFFY